MHLCICSSLGACQVLTNVGQEHEISAGPPHGTHDALLDGSIGRPDRAHAAGCIVGGRSLAEVQGDIQS